MESSISARVKVKSLKDPSIPYILNGELYEILTQHGDNVTVRCSSCPADRVYRGSVRSTGNFHMHIKRRHPELLGKLHEMKVGSLLERRERLLNAKKLVIRGRIKKESSGSGETLEMIPTQCQNIAHPIDYSCRNSSHSAPSEEVFTNNTQSPIPSENEPQILIATEIHCDSEANMGIQRTPIYFTTIKEETSSSLDNEQAMDLTTPNSRRCESPLTHQMSNLKWEHVLQRVEGSLKNIQHEMRTRNQIETNRIFLDLAKFKFLNPGFRYQS
ncbi:protein stand still [Episyrphus balteatus]|uniref:protein stand still n=1 Tax=Episyrphus balteatus TaxID=286459 RepID=UPI0024853C16|nr:protein stand still [Episyrphus balteatus]